MAGKNKDNQQTFHYKEEEIIQGIEAVEKMDLPSPIKNLIIHCLNTLLNINSLLQKNRSRIGKINAIFLTFCLYQIQRLPLK